MQRRISPQKNRFFKGRNCLNCYWAQTWFYRMLLWTWVSHQSASRSQQKTSVWSKDEKRDYNHEYTLNCCWTSQTGTPFLKFPTFIWSIKRRTEDGCRRRRRLRIESAFRTQSGEGSQDALVFCQRYCFSIKKNDLQRSCSNPYLGFAAERCHYCLCSWSFI